MIVFLFSDARNGVQSLGMLSMGSTTEPAPTPHPHCQLLRETSLGVFGNPRVESKLLF